MNELDEFHEQFHLEPADVEEDVAWDDVDLEEMDWGLVKRDELAEALAAAFNAAIQDHRDLDANRPWLAVADKAIEVILGD